MPFGLDRLSSDPALAPLRTKLSGSRVAVLAHPASVAKDFRHISDVLRSLKIAPALYFGPEHGFGGEAQDMIGVTDARDPSGVPIRSLYGAFFSDLSPTPADLANVDCVVIDLQDVGSRYYTFVWTAVLVLRAAVSLGKQVVVLDRPNPIGHSESELEGVLPADPKYLSFVGLEPIAIRHSMTLGEVVALFAKREGMGPEALTIVSSDPVSGHASQWDRPFIPPSPNMPTYDTALVYPGGCLLEGTNLSEGRGTTRPFEFFGAPWLDGARLATDFAKSALPGVVVRPVTFHPMFQKHGGTQCGGGFVHVTDPRSFRPIATYLTLIALARRQDPDAFQWRTELYEFRDDVPAIDLLLGGPAGRELMTALGSVAPELLSAKLREIHEFTNVGAAERSILGEARAAKMTYAR